jgi:hypothetical protein
MQALSQLSYTPDEAINYIERPRIVQVDAGVQTLRAILEKPPLKPP